MLPARAVPYWEAAGERALRRAAFLEAADHFRRGLEALDEAGALAGDRATLLTQLGASLQAGIGYAAPGVDEAYAEARRTLTDGPLVPIIRGQWSYHLLRAQYAQAAPFADEMLALGERSGDPLRLADGHLRQGMLRMYLGDFLGAREHLTAAYANYARPDDRQQAAGDIGVAALAYLSSVLWYLGEPEESLQRSDASLSLEERVGGPVTRAQAWGMRSLLHLARSELAELGRWIERAHAHSTEYNVGYWRALSSLLRGWMQARGGELEAGRRRVDEGLQAYLRSGALLGLSRFYVLRAGLCVMAGDRAGAFRDVEAAEQHVAQTGERYAEAELYRFKGRLLIETDPARRPRRLRARRRRRARAVRRAARAASGDRARRAGAHERHRGDHGRACGRAVRALPGAVAAARRRPRPGAARRRGRHPVTASVTIAGGGLAGLTAALRLAERGYRVKLYERAGMLGGNLASRPAGAGLQLDVYPHMYLNWYRNFWALLGDVTDADRDAAVPAAGRRQAARGRRLSALHGADRSVQAVDGPEEHVRRPRAAAGPVPVLLREHRPDGRAAEPDAAARRRQRQRVPARAAVHDRARGRAVRQLHHQRLGRAQLPRLRRRLPGLPRPTAPPTRRRRSGSPAARRSRR